MTGLSDAGTPGGSFTYSYDAMGNQTSDGRQGLLFCYNILNLPCGVTSATSGSLTYTYLSDGTKVSAVREDGSGKRYLGSAVYDVDFFVPQGFDARVLFRDHFGIIIGDDVPVETIKLKVEASQVKYYRSLPLHHSQREIETTLDYSVFEYHLATTFDFWQEVLSKGDTVEVLEPSEFRSWIADTVANLNKTYNK